MADQTATATAPAPVSPPTGCGGGNKVTDVCCPCCTEVYEFRALYRERQDVRAKIQDQALQNSVNNADRASKLATSNDDLAQKAFLAMLTQPQDNPVGVAGVASLNAGAAAQNGIAGAQLQQLLSAIQSMQGQWNALVSMIANLAHSTPSSPGSTAQQTGVATKP